MNSLPQITPEPNSAHTFARVTPAQFFILIAFMEDKSTEKSSFALHGYGSAPDDPTIMISISPTKCPACLDQACPTTPCLHQHFRLFSLKGNEI